MAEKQEKYPNLNAPIRSGEEARDMGRRGGKKSGESRRQKKTLSQATADVLCREITDAKQLSKIQKAGIPCGENPTYRDYLVASLVLRYIDGGTVDDLMKLAAFIGEEAEEKDGGQESELALIIAAIAGRQKPDAGGIATDTVQSDIDGGGTA